MRVSEGEIRTQSRQHHYSFTCRRGSIKLGRIGRQTRCNVHQPARAYEPVGQWPQPWQQPAQLRMWVRAASMEFSSCDFFCHGMRAAKQHSACVCVCRIAQTNRSWCDNQHGIESQKPPKNDSLLFDRMVTRNYAKLCAFCTRQSVSQSVNHSTVWFSFNVQKCHSFASPHLMLLPSKIAPKNIQRIFPQYVKRERERERTNYMKK